MTQLIINNLPVDIPINFSPTLSNKFFDVSNPINKFNTISFSIILPFTPSNRLVFKNIVHNDVTQKFNKSVYKAILLSDNTEIFKGEFFLDSIGDGYVGNLVGTELLDFYNLIKDKTLNDLSSVETIAKTNGVIEAFNLGDGGSDDIYENIWNQLSERSDPVINDYKGFIFPYMARFHRNYQSPEIPLNVILDASHTFDELLPAFYIKEVIDLIGVYTGYNFVSSDELNEDLQPLIMPYTNNKPFEWGFGTGSKFGHVYTTVPATGDPTTWTGAQILTNDGNFSKKGNYITQGHITYDCDFSGYLKINVFAGKYNPLVPPVPSVFLSGTVYKSGQTSDLIDTGELIVPFNALDNNAEIYYAVEKGDMISVKIDSTDPLRFFLYLDIRYVVRDEKKPLTDSEAYTDLGSDVPYAINLPDMKISDFLNGICGLLGYYLKINNSVKTFSLLKYDKILNNQLINTDKGERLKTLEIQSYSYKPSTTKDFLVSYTFDDKDGYRVDEDVYNLEPTIKLPFAKSYYTSYLHRPNIYIPSATLMTEEVKNQDRVTINWDAYVEYEDWFDYLNYYVGDKVKISFDIYQTPTDPIDIKGEVFYSCILDNTNVDPRNPNSAWVLDASPYEYNSDISYDFKPRVLKFIGAPVTGNVVSANGSIIFDYNYRFWTGSFFDNISESYFLTIPRTEFDSTLEYDYITNNNFKPLEGILNNDTHIIEWRGRINKQEWTSWLKGIPIININGAKHLITEVTQWNVNNTSAIGKAIRFVNPK
jgi:hypothetical protein